MRGAGCSKPHWVVTASSSVALRVKGVKGAGGKIEIDVCEEHGVWLDQGELKAITDRVQRIEKIKAHTRTIGEVRRARHSGKVSAYLFGPLAFLFTDR